MKKATHRVLTIALLILTASASIRAAVQVEDLAKDGDILQMAIDTHHDTIKAEMEPIEPTEDPEYAKMLNSTKNMCVNGKDVTKLSQKEYLVEFAKGPCNPAVFLPGIGGSKLRVMIDCKELQAKDPSTFAACGWKRCSGLQTPKSEYKVWIPTPFAPMSITINSENARNCFNAVMGFDTSEINKGIIKSRPGLTVVIEGNIPLTKD